MAMRASVLGLVGQEVLLGRGEREKRWVEKLPPGPGRVVGWRWGLGVVPLGDKFVFVNELRSFSL